MDTKTTTAHPSRYGDAAHDPDLESPPPASPRTRPFTTTLPPAAPPPYSESDYVTPFPPIFSSDDHPDDNRHFKSRFFALLLFFLAGIPAATYILLTVLGYELEPEMDAAGMVALAVHVISGVYYCSRFGDERFVSGVAFGWGVVYSAFLFVWVGKVVDEWWEW